MMIVVSQILFVDFVENLLNPLGLGVRLLECRFSTTIFSKIFGSAKLTMDKSRSSFSVQSFLAVCAIARNVHPRGTPATKTSSQSIKITTLVDLISPSC